MTTWIPNVLANVNGKNQVIGILDWSTFGRNVWINGEISDETVPVIVSELQFMGTGSSEPVNVFINSPGGTVTAGFAIINAIQFLQAKGIVVRTIIVSEAASMAAVVASAGTPGQRYIMPRSSAMIHQPLAGTQGKLAQMETDLLHFQKTKVDLYRLLAETTNHTVQEIEQDCRSDHWLDPDEAIKYGIADHILTGFDFT